MAKYERIADDLREKIRSGALAPGDRLPTEQALCTEYRVSLPVVRRALDVLAAEALTSTKHGVGTYVRVPRQPVRRTPERYQWEKDRARLPEAQRRRTGATERDTGLIMVDLDFHAEFQTVPADEDLAAVFGVPVGAKLLRRTYKTRSKDENAPFSLIHSYLMYDVAAENPALLDPNNEPWPGGTQHQLHTIDIEVDRITDRIGARPPGPGEVEALDLPPGVPVFTLRKTSFDIHGRAVEISDAVIPADRTEFFYTTKLIRWSE
ncbi:MAG: GntR family transcriptional regulator [Micromonosporaceae bacterium]